MNFDHNKPLSFVRQYKLQWEPAQQAWVLLYPEGLVKLAGSAGEILKRVDGERNAAAIVADLQAEFPEADLQKDVLDFLEHASLKGWIHHD